MFARAESHIAVDYDFDLPFFGLSLDPRRADKHVAEFYGAIMLAPDFDPVVAVHNSFNRFQTACFYAVFGAVFL